MSEANPEIIRAVEHAEKSEAEARLRCDLPALDSFWSDELVVNSTENLLLTKAQFLDRLRSGALRYSGFQRRTIRTCNLGNVVVAIGGEEITPATGHEEGNPLSCSYMNVWQIGSSGPRLAARQVAPMVSGTGLKLQGFIV